MTGGICFNEWLIQAGLLTLSSTPTEVTRFAKVEVDWDRTLAWADGGYYGRLFMNVRGREPRGVIAANDYERVRDEIAERILAIPDPDGQPLGTRVFKPDHIYRSVRNVAPDLLVYFGDLAWRSIGSVGHGRVHTFENDTGPDDANHAQHGIFILHDGQTRASGPVPGVRLLDLAPTILDLVGEPIPADMLGASMIRTIRSARARL
jgi:predicted AlkP superfamily phosphohydrolase/phosphomutase